MNRLKAHAHKLRDLKEEKTHPCEMNEPDSDDKAKI